MIHSRRLASPLLLAISLVSALPPAMAQSAGETALFLMTGRDGLDFGPTGVAVTSDATLTCPDDPSRTCRVYTTVMRLSPCRYQTDAMAPELSVTMVTDFSQVARIGFERSIPASPYVDTAAFGGARGVMCAKGAAPWTCMERDTVTPSIASPIDQQRFADAFAYMRRTFCPGRAY